MIHLDRGHPSAIAGHSKSNLILADPPHADQHSLLSWSPSTRTDTTFYHDSQEPFALTSDPAKHTIPSDPAPGQKQDQPAPATANHGPITPGDAEEPNLPEPSPSSPADPRSPVADTSSSLSPPPDAATPSAAAAAAAASDPGSNGDKPPGSGGEAAGEVEAPTEGDKGSSAEEVDKASRASTPLSELSSAPDDEEEYKTKEGGASVGGPSPSGHKETHEADGPNKSAPQGATSKGHASAASNAQSPREAPPEASSSHSNPAKFASDARGSSIIHSSSSSVSSPFSQPDIASLGSDVTLPNHVSAASAGAKLDPKVVTTLELNNQLLSVMTALLNRGYSSENPLVSQYGAHVQSNLAWLAAAADGKEKGRNNVPLPKMTPPPRIDFLSMDRIHQLYSEMSAAFAKEIARRAQAGAASHGMSLPGDLQNGLKRNRPDELFPDLANKRRDTGDSKLSTPIASTPQLSNALRN
ncbi:hypothetical protein EVJ58_g9794 [Rhodofomes roseus]|uniref:Uncharacterized protein n=1 Tax=Rhodofomes roseus TaxID=34475 RepID=A0A4Y9XTW5_9APHY|nr:hypothetical protein EVJ58_g9794 [Rhodofomes roseus]